MLAHRMSIKILIDMDHRPLPSGSAGDRLVRSTARAVGDPRATDRTIMDWAEVNGYIVFTHDLDFGTILALTHKTGPSVVQLRGQDILPDRMGNLVIAAIGQHESDLKSGALVVVEEGRNRVRILPI